MFSDKIRKLRIENGLNQQTVANKLNVNKSAIGMYEQGRRSPSLDIVVAYARLFSVTTDYLLVETEE